MKTSDTSERIYDPVARDFVSRQFIAMKTTHDHIHDTSDSPRYAKK